MKDRAKNIEELAEKDNKTNDTEYNKGLKAIKDFGYQSVSTLPEIKYWCMCNNV